MPLLCSAILVILYGALSVNVSRVRLWRNESLRVAETQLTQAVRAHGNAAEYIPLLVALLLYLDFTAPSFFLSVAAVVATASRVLHAVAMLLVQSATPRSRLRFLGAIGTYASLFALAGVLVWRAV